MSEPPRPRVLLADDNAGVRDAISRLLSRTCDLVASVSDVPALFKAVVEFRPDVVLLDLSLPGALDGFQICRRLKTTTPEVNVVAFTAHDDPQIRRLAFEAGASGFVWKPQAVSDLVSTIRDVVDRATPPGQHGSR